MSHHFDSAAARADGRINLCDLYAFPAGVDASALILTVNPDAGRSSPTTFRPDALYEFVLASNGGTSEDIAFRVVFTEPDGQGRQQVRILRAAGPGRAGTLLGEGRTGEVFAMTDGGLAWARPGLGLPPIPSTATASPSASSSTAWPKAATPPRCSPPHPATCSPVVT